MSLLINKVHKWAFVHIPKTGGTSVNKVLLNQEGTEFITSHDSIRMVPDENFFIFTTVRNPYTRFFSAWLHGIRKNIYPSDFGSFLKQFNESDVWFLPQTYYIEQGKTNNRKVSYIAKYENIRKDVNKAFERINIHSPLPHLNKNPIYEKHPNLNQEKYYSFLYTDEMKMWVRERYKDDFKQFNYELEI